MICALRLYRAGVFSAATRYFKKAQELDAIGFQNYPVEGTPEELSLLHAQQDVFAKLKAGMEEAEEARSYRNLESAIAIADKLLLIAPNDPALLSSIGCFYIEKFMQDVNFQNLSPSHLKLLVEAEGDIAGALESYRHALFKLLVEAEDRINHALELDRYLPTAHNNLGLVYALTRRPNDAAKCYTRALELQANYPEAQKNLSDLMEVLGDEIV
jgi:tetratricopeptide (TPR) repeat protein